jgi:hypothetical protein
MLSTHPSPADRCLILSVTGVVSDGLVHDAPLQGVTSKRIKVSG